MDLSKYLDGPKAKRQRKKKRKVKSAIVVHDEMEMLKHADLEEDGVNLEEEGEEANAKPTRHEEFQPVIVTDIP